MKKLFLELLACTDEHKISAILDSSNDCNNSANWKPLGNNANNASLVQNTSTTLGSCLAEILTNSFDAVLQREINEIGLGNINSEHLQSPELLINYIISLKLKQNSNFNLKDYADDNINVITAEDLIGTRHFTFMDKGIGQDAINFEHTFCSVGAGNQNKANKSYLHGNYGQGSTSANALSGDLGYKLIISRTSKAMPWSATIIRRNPLKLSMLEYLTINGMIPTFEKDYIDLVYTCSGELFPEVARLEFGSAIKIFSVGASKGFTSIKQNLGSVLFRPILPIKSIELTPGKDLKKQVDKRWIRGMGDTLDELVNDNKAISHPFEMYLPEMDGYAYGMLYYIKKREDKKEILQWLPSIYSEQGKRIFHLNNGQVQHTDSSLLISQHYPHLKDQLYIEMDLSHLNPEKAKAYLWKADRTSFLLSSSYYKNYNKQLISFLKECPALKEWNEQAKNEIFNSLKTNNNTNTENYAFLAQIAGVTSTKKLILAKKLTISDNNLPTNYIQGENTSPNQQYTHQCQGKTIPTVFESSHSTKDKAKKTTVKKLNSSLKTDAKKGHVGTPSSKGKVTINQALLIRSNEIQNELDLSKIRLTISQNKDNTINIQAILTDELIQQVKIGDTIMLKISLSDKKDDYSLSNVVYYEIIEEEQEIKPTKKTQNDYSKTFNFQFGTKDGREYNEQSTWNLSSQSDFNYSSAWFTLADSEQLSICLNLDNPQLIEELESKKSQQEKSNFLTHWKNNLMLVVMTSYNYWTTEEKIDINQYCEKLNDASYAINENIKAIAMTKYIIATTNETIKKRMAA